MDKQEVAMLGFEIVAYAGEARSYLLQALKSAEQKKIRKSRRIN